MLPIKQISDFELENKNIIIREDLNVPLKDGKITSFERIDACIPSIKKILNQGANISILSHLGRPIEGTYDKKYSLEIIIKALEERVGEEVSFNKNFFQDFQIDFKNKLTLCENVRFIPGEKKGSKDIANKISTNCDLFIMDAFGVSHRKHMSCYTLAQTSKAACAGPLLINEIDSIKKAVSNAENPVVAIIGGAKVSSKLGVIKSLLDKVDVLILGGGIANTFLSSTGHKVGKSLWEPELVNKCNEIIKIADSKKVFIPLPEDVVCLNDSQILKKAINEINNDDIIKDVGEKTIKKYKEVIETAKTIIWNGPIGVFEEKEFQNGTENVCRSVTNSKAYSLVGGGDTIAAVESFDNLSKISYVSTGGGAFLNFIENDDLPVLKLLKK